LGRASMIWLCVTLTLFLNGLFELFLILRQRWDLK
jgi:hypothetical protein